MKRKKREMKGNIKTNIKTLICSCSCSCNMNKNNREKVNTNPSQKINNIFYLFLIVILIKKN